MPALSPSIEFDSSLAAHARELFDERRRNLHCSTDRNFAILMVCQWIAALLFTLLVSPRTWSGASSGVHPHVWLALLFGSAVTGVPVALALMQPGRTATRHIVAASQALMSALLIHITGGRIETHFHVFGSLAFLAFYRDWRVLITASAVVAADHFFRGLYWPQSVFGVVTASSWRWLEHAGWVVFEDIFLVISIRQNVAEMQAVAERQAKLEAVNCELLHENSERRRSEEALHTSELRFRQMAENIQQVFWVSKPNAEELIYVSPAYEQLWGRTCASAHANPQSWMEAIVVEDRPLVMDALVKNAGGETFDIEYRISRPDGSLHWVRDRGFPVRDQEGKVVRVCGLAEDITVRKQTEAELDQAHKELLETSRKAGMAEVATSVLHNVGNVLNSVNISLGVAMEKAGQMKGTSLSRVAALLRDHSGNLPEFFTNHPQGPRLPQFLGQLAEQFVSDQELMLRELESLRTNIEHINEIVVMQQSYATAGGLIEEFPLAELVDDALRMHAAAFERHGTRVIHDFDRSLPRIAVDRNKVLLILVNLIHNAKYACDEAGHDHKAITVRTHLNGENVARISVSDNGIGIPLENFTRIFEHGFTTRKGGHGFGLHSSALAAAEMGGTLRVQSDGPNRGATFTLELPVSSASGA